MTVAELETMASARRQRDAFFVKPGEDVPPPVDVSETEGERPEKPENSEPAPMDLGRQSPTQFDPQLKKAVEAILAKEPQRN